MVWEERKGGDILFGDSSYDFSIYSSLLTKDIQKHKEDKQLLKGMKKKKIYIYTHTRIHGSLTMFTSLGWLFLWFVFLFTLFFFLTFKNIPSLLFPSPLFLSFFFFYFFSSNSWFIMYFFRYSSIYYLIHFKPFSPCSFVSILPLPFWSSQKLWARPLPSSLSTTTFCAYFCDLGSRGAENSWFLRAPYLDVAELRWATATLRHECGRSVTDHVPTCGSVRGTEDRILTSGNGRGVAD